jgi:hypothetical protein
MPVRLRIDSMTLLPFAEPGLAALPAVLEVVVVVPVLLVVEPVAPAPVVVAPGVVCVETLGVVVEAEGVLVAGVVMVVVVAGAWGPEPPASFTKAAASTPSESTTTTTAATSGAFQLGEAARRVRAAAPQFRHHSCSGCRGAPQSGQLSPLVARGVGTPTMGASPAVPAGEGAGALTGWMLQDG